MADKKKEPKVVLEREYNIPLRRKFLNTPKYKRSKKAIKTVREFISELEEYWTFVFSVKRKTASASELISIIHQIKKPIANAIIRKNPIFIIFPIL